MKLNSIGLDSVKTQEITVELNELLANFQLYYQNLRGIHWNIKGRGFFDLHVKFEELYTEATVSIDEIAERILTLGSVPLHTFEEYMHIGKIPVGKNISKDEDAVRLVLESISELLIIERKILEKAGDSSDEGTNAMMSDFIAAQEKIVWMMKAWLGETV